MKSLLGIIGGIVFIMLSFGGIVYYKNSTEKTQQMKSESKLEENVLGFMVSSEEKIQEAQKLLSGKDQTKEIQTKATKLIEESITDARKAVNEQPDNPRTWYYLSEGYQKLLHVNSKAAPLAIDALTHAIKLAPNDPSLLNKRATVYIHQKNYKAAEEDLLKAIKLDPDSANSYYKLGNVYKETNRRDKARALYLQAQELTPDNNKMAHAQIEYQLKELEKGEDKSTK